MTLQKLRHVAQHDYDCLCQHMRIAPVPLDIDLGAPGRDGYGGAPSFRIRLRYTENDLDVVPTATVTFPPKVWDENTREGWRQWPKWRTDLWHETVHQVEHQVFGHFDPKMNLRPAHDWPEWKDAIADVASKFPGLTPAVLERLLWSF